MHHPGFSCPLCRTFADLDADVEIETRDSDPITMEDIDMGLEDVEEVHTEGDADSHSPHRPSVIRAIREASPDPGAGNVRDTEDAEDAEDADGDRTSSSLSSNGAPIDTDPASNSISISRPDSGEMRGFPGAEATPLNSTFLATLARTAGDGNVASSAGTSLSVPMRNTVLDSIAMSEGESGEEGGSSIGGKRKR